jgi:hypothetical protein
MGLKRKQHRRDLLDIESILQSSLKPISPRPEFIQSLQKGLMEYTFPQTELSEIDQKKVILFAFIGFTGLVFVFSLWVRLIIVIISTLGMIQSSKQNKVENK